MRSFAEHTKLPGDHCSERKIISGRQGSAQGYQREAFLGVGKICHYILDAKAKPDQVFVRAIFLEFQDGITYPLLRMWLECEIIADCPADLKGESIDGRF